MMPIRNAIPHRLKTWTLAADFLLLAACSGDEDPTRPSPAPRDGPSLEVGSAGPSAVLVGAGDIADCTVAAESTARLLDTIPGTVFTSGDNAYPDGSAINYTNCYEPTWGRHKTRTSPSPGNHEYHIAGAADYFNYFGSAAGPSGLGYYSYELGNGAWHIVSLNSEIATSSGSPQEDWLRKDLASHPAQCTLAYWHRPLFTSSSKHLPYPAIRPIYQVLYDAGADLVISAHNHQYERFAPQNPAGGADAAHGLRYFVVGTGGAGLYGFGTPKPNSEFRDGVNHGVLKLTLDDAGYSWTFISSSGATIDGGNGVCHPAPAAAGTVAPDGGNGQSATAGTSVATPPSVKVTDASNAPLADVAVTFAVGSGGGSVTGSASTTDAQGIATVGGWTLGTTAGANTLTASAAGFSGNPVSFTGTGTPGPTSAVASTATVPNGKVGSATPISVQAKDQYGNSLTTGGATVVVRVSGANAATPAVTDNNNGTYVASYTPAAGGTDQVAITLDATAIKGSPYTSTVTAASGGTASTMAVNDGNNQSAPVSTAVPVPPSVRVLDAKGSPASGVKVNFSITLGGGTATGKSPLTDANGVARVGSWTLGPSPVTNRLQAKVANNTTIPATVFVATGTTTATRIVVNDGNNQSARAGTAVPVPPSARVLDANGQPVVGIRVNFSITLGGGTATGKSPLTDANGIARVGSWTLGPARGTNRLRATVASTTIPVVVFVATGT